MKQVTFHGAFFDGLVEMSGEEFIVDGYALVVHKGRDPYQLQYHVSEKSTGFAVPIPDTRNKRRAIDYATAIWKTRNPHDLEICMKKAAQTKAMLEEKVRLH